MKLFKETKEKGKFYKVVVLPCSNDDEIYLDCRDQFYIEEEIAILISTEANNCLFDYNHKDPILKGITTVQNYQSKVEEYINEFRVPVGSWIKIIFSENDCINEKIDKGIIKGVSNDFDINTQKSYCKCNNDLPPGVNTFVYSDVKEKECIIQGRLSFVDYPCNFMPIGVYTYEEYKMNNGDIVKLKNGMNKIFNKKEEDKEEEYKFENSDDVIKAIDDITDKKIKNLNDNLEQLFGFVDEDLEWLKGDLESIRAEVESLTEDEESDEEGSDEAGTDESDASINNDDDSSDDKVNKTLDKIINRLDDIDKELQKRPVIKNQKMIKNLGKQPKVVRGLFNRDEEDK